VARQPRIELPGIAQHIVQRGNNRHACFAGPSDYAGYLLELAEAVLKHNCAIHAYVLNEGLCWIPGCGLDHQG
jgi:putative transposase